MDNQASLGDISGSQEEETEGASDEKEAGFVDIPEDWSVEIVKEAADPEQENAFTDGDWVESSDMDEEGNIQLVQLGHLGEGVFQGEPNRFVNEEFAEEEDCTFLEEGELMISRMQEPILRACLLPEFEKESIMAVDIARLRPKEEWNKQFLKYLFNSRPVWKQGLAWASGTTRKRVSRSNLAKVELQKPEKDEQRRIASVLYNMDQAINKTEEIIEQTQRVKKGLMQDLFTEGYYSHEEFQETKYGKAPANWEVKKISDVTDNIQAGGTPNTDKEEYYGGEIPWVKTGELKQDVVTETGQTITKEGFKNSTARKFPEGTVLVAMYGATTGKTSRLGIEATTNQACCGIQVNSEIGGYFLHQQLEFFNENLIALSAGSGQQNISKSTIVNFDVLIPPKEEQEEISETLRNIQRKLNKHKEEKEQLQRLKKGLMQDLLTGSVRTGEDVRVLDEVVV